ncbi:phosphoglycerate dehydrogenase-like enzyme [Erwinia toletana]|uniref:Phosphoglycerate dehydrogenase-like enzyme n=1 Tax=Winslowiella toletana TaxID=92490 RepID=A0ABS4P8J1_9GAMM|nr:D-2-hydroxyacid dehydrogenase [Winslowiella toletana]MBP2168954.1 phosphoglycerate dehydrogenase-like enzyme [Winslowiella toletana]
MHIHIENDASAPQALQLPVELLQQRIDANPLLRGKFTLSENSDAERVAAFLPAAEILWAGRKLPLYHYPTPQLKWVQVMSAGVESWLEKWPAAIQLVNASGVHGDKGAEFILMAALMFNYGIPGFLQDQASQQWRPTFGGCARGKKVLLLGVGGIGAAAAAMLTRQGYEVCGVTRSGYSEAELARCIAMADIDAELADTDVLVSTLPLTAETEGLFNARRLAQLPARAGVIIVGRARVFDYHALREMLSQQQLAGAVLDVFPQEPLPAGDPLWHCPGLIITPHCSLDDHGAYLEGCLSRFIQNLERYQAGEPLINRVNPETGY